MENPSKQGQSPCPSEFPAEPAAAPGHCVRFRRLFDAMTQGVVYQDRDGRIISANPSAERILGIALEDMTNRPAWEFLREDGTPLPAEEHPAMVALRTGQNVSGVTLGVYHRPLQQHRWILVDAFPSFHPGETTPYEVFTTFTDITQHKLGETALKESEERFRAIANYTYNWENWIAPDGKLVWINPAVERMTGYTSAECYAMPDYPVSLIHPDDRDTFTQHFVAALGGESGDGVEMRFLRKDGSMFFGSVSWLPIYDEHGRYLGHRSSVRDITVKKQALEELYNAKQVVQLVLDHIPLRVFWKDLDSVYLGANKAYLAEWGLASSADLKGKTDFDLHPPQLAKKYRKDDRKVILGNQPKINIEDKMIRDDGEVRWAQTYKVPLHNPQGGVIGVLGIYDDVTEKKLMQQRLAETLQQMQTILDNTQVGIAFLKDRRFIWINHRMEDMFGYKMGQLRESCTEVLYPSHEDFELVGEQAYQQLVQGKPFETERLLRRKNGRIFWCHLRGMAVNPHDMAQGSIWTLLDIDSRKSAEQKLLDLNATLAQQVSTEIARGMEKERILIHQARHAAMGEMIGNIAHQWRQPLSVLGLILQNIQIDFEDKLLDGDALTGYVADAMNSIRQMSSTIDDFRDFFSPARYTTVFNVCSAVQDALNLVKASLKNNNIEVRLSGSKDIQMIGHPNELAQVLLNLIGNAKDALLERTPSHPEIGIETASDGSHATIMVSDNAGGVSPEIAEKIFDPYFTTKDKGTGIGLYMVKTIVEQRMGGTIAFCNGERGAEFRVVLPLEHAGADEAEAP